MFVTGCVGTGPQTEYEFVASLADRDADSPLICRGPLVALVMDANRLALLRSALHRPTIHAMVNPQRHPSGMCRVLLCAQHWLDVSYEATRSATRYERTDWLLLADAVLRSTCNAVSWDTKEIANLFRWQRLAA